MVAMNDNELRSDHSGVPEPVAIVGMACTFAKAPDLATYWHNIIHKVDAIEPVPENRWDSSRFYDPDTTDGTKIYARRGGYLPSPMPFEPIRFGIMPKAVQGGEPDQFLVLKTAADALQDAGIEPGPAHERTEFILGRGAYLSAGGFNLLQRSFVVRQTVDIIGQLHPDMSSQDLQTLAQRLAASLLPFEAETAPSVMPNISAGRVANRMDFMGPNFVIDAACASSLFAVATAVANLRSGQSDLALAGGVHIFNNVPFLSVFCSLGAMSRQDQIRPFDKDADGLLPGEGVGVVVLKRHADAVRDGDRIYALIKGVGSSSDGRATSVAAPSPSGAALALERAYRVADISPDTVDLIEAHGTATLAGDASEIEALSRVFGPRDAAAARHCALGSVKSMIGHTMPASGIAGLIKTALAIYHKVLPPTLHCREPHPKFKLEQTPFYINTETRPWFKTKPGLPRRAGVNAFGFGGVNAHVVLEECAAAGDVETSPSGPAWDAALFLFSADSQAGLAERCADALATLSQNPDMDVTGWSKDLVQAFSPLAHRIAFISESSEDLTKKLTYAFEKLNSGKCRKIKDVKGIYYFSEPLGKTGKVAFMFPAEGSPYPDMLRDLCLHFPQVRDVFAEVDAVIAARSQRKPFLPSQFVFQPTLLTASEQQALTDELWKVDSGLQAILGASLGMHALLDHFGIRPDMVVGHSAGEYTAWIASGILDRKQFYGHQEAIARIYTDHPCPVETRMAAVAASIDRIGPIMQQVPGRIYISNDNCPHQVVVLGEVEAMTRFCALLKERNILYADLPSSEVHHTPLASHHADMIMAAFACMGTCASRMPIYSAITAGVYPQDRQEVLRLMVQYWLQPLRFRQTVEAMHDDGARIFIEVGPGSNLSGFVDDTLRGRPCMTVIANSSRRSGIAQFCHLLGMLVAQHVDVRLDAYQPPGRLGLQGKNDDAELSGEKRKKAVLHLDLGLTELRLAPADVAATVKALGRRDTVTAKASAPARGQADPAPVTADPAPTPSSPLPAERMMNRYRDNVSGAMSLEKQMSSRLVNGRPGPAADVGLPPMVDRIILDESPERCHVRRTITLAKDRFLLDHPFGGRASDADPALLPLIVTPMTLNMEMMLETAALLAPDRVPVEIRSVKANRWVEVDEQKGATLDARGYRSSENQVRVQLVDTAASSYPCAEAEVVLGKQFPPSAMGEPISVHNIDKEAATRAKEIYSGKWMFHGPAFQTIAALSRTGPRQMEACLYTADNHPQGSSGVFSRWSAHPMILDACAQLTGYWAQRALNEKFITFPAGVKSIRFFAPSPGPGQLLRCRVQVNVIDDHFVQSDIEIINADGRRWAVVSGWTHRRFDLPETYYRFWRFPREYMASDQIDIKEQPVPTVRCRAGYHSDLNQTIWKKVIAMHYLNREERQVYGRKVAEKDNDNQWLVERIAAKDAVRHYLKQQYHFRLLPADINILPTPSGHYTPRWPGDAAIGPGMELMVKHKDQFAEAAVAEVIRQEKKSHG